MRRECGSCTACCYALSVESGVTIDDETMVWRKPRRERCGYLCEAGCSIYSERPIACVDFACEWLCGVGLDEHRPDRCGVVLFASQLEMFDWRPILSADEAYPGAFNEQRFGRIFGLPILVHERGPRLLVVYPDGRRQRLADCTTSTHANAKSVPYETILEIERETPSVRALYSAARLRVLR